MTFINVRRVANMSLHGDWLRGLIWALSGIFVITLSACQKAPVESIDVAQTSPFQFSSRPSASTDVEVQVVRTPTVRFDEVASSIGISHTYLNGERGKSIMVETLGGGCGWLDFDADGNWDLYLNQGGDPTRPVDASQPVDALYRNRDTSGYQNIADKARIAETGYGQGVAIGDYDNDGFDDIYVTNVADNTFWKNMGDGTFQEIATASGTNDVRWSTSAAWADLDRDGDLDLYVCNYLQYDPLNPLDCRTKDGKSRICHPKDIEAWPDECFFNQGDGTFIPEAKQRGLYGPGNKALGVVVADFNNDELPDIYVANDTTANFLFVNQGDGSFQEDAYLLGCAVDRNGSFQASMGLGIADVDGNGFLDVYATHFYEESNTLYLNLGSQGFQDATGLTGMHSLTMAALGFGVVVADFDQNMAQDIFVTNGHVENFPGNPLRNMSAQLIASDGQSWRDYSQLAGTFFREKRAGRGVGACDFDADGDVDLAVVHQNDPVAILRNDSQRGHWLKLLFHGRESNRRGVGCRVTVRTEDGTKIVQELYGGGSYASTHQPTLIYGLGSYRGSCDIDVVWPSGQRQQLAGVEIDRELILNEPRR